LKITLSLSQAYNHDPECLLYHDLVLKFSPKLWLIHPLIRLVFATKSNL